MSDHGQVQLRLPVQPPASPRPPTCGSSASHISLRRFAAGYVFGTSSRLGPTDSVSPATTPSTSDAPAFAPPADAPDFASLSNIPANSSQPIPPSHPTPPAPSWTPSSPSPSRRRRSSCPVASPCGTPISESSGGPVSRVLPLSVRTRPIERRSVPKRCRETVSVDALAAMVERVLGNGGGSWRARAGVKKMRAESGGKVIPRTGAVAAFGEPMRINEEGKEKEKENERERERKDSFSKLEDEDTADELSFLVEKCDLDSERKQSMFMPYIT